MESSKSQNKKTDIKANAVIYEVNLTVDVDVIEPFDLWLHQHTEEMLAIPGFISASTSVPDVEDETQKYRCVQYRLSDQKALDNYLKNHAEAMRAKALEQFEGHFTAKRRVLSVAEAALAKQGVCANCEAELIGRFCNVCGQREEPRVPTLGSVTSEFTNEVFVVESKLWRSFYLLLFKPGELTAAYLTGKRQKYMSPIRLYLLFSITAFAFLAFLNSNGELDIQFETAPEAEVSQDHAELARPSSRIDDLDFNSGFLSDEVNQQVEARIKKTLHSIKADLQAGDRQAVIDKFVGPLPKVLFLFLPLVALLFKLLYLGSGRYYVEHLIYLLHNHAFLFAVMVVTGVISEIVNAWPGIEIIVALGLLATFSFYAYRYFRQIIIQQYSDSRVKPFLTLLLLIVILALVFQSTITNGIATLSDLLWFIYVPFYLYYSLRVVYLRSRLATTLSLLVISIMYMMLLMIVLVSSAVMVGFTYT